MECFKVRIEEVEKGCFTVFSADGNKSYYFGDSFQDCIDWCNEEANRIKKPLIICN